MTNEMFNNFIQLKNIIQTSSAKNNEQIDKICSFINLKTFSKTVIVSLNENVFTYCNDLEHYIFTTPIIFANKKISTLLCYKNNNGSNFSKDDIVLIEMCCGFLSINLGLKETDLININNKKITDVKSALNALTYSEIESIIKIIECLNGVDGVLISSNIAKELEISRSVIVNALKKLESASIIETRSLGVKGTYIKIINDKLYDEISNYE